MIGLSEATYYYKPKVSRADKEQADAALRDKIENLQAAQYSCWGYRTLKVQLFRHYGLQINAKRILRVMRKYDLFRHIKPLKNEEVYLWEYENFTDVIERIPEFIQEVYNRKRVHSGIQYLPPEEFEVILQDEHRKKSLGQVTLEFPD
ncbi:MAG: IS3 family transposase [Pseudomonadota bacterium]